MRFQTQNLIKLYDRNPVNLLNISIFIVLKIFTLNIARKVNINVFFLVKKIKVRNKKILDGLNITLKLIQSPPIFHFENSNLKYKI